MPWTVRARGPLIPEAGRAFLPGAGEGGLIPVPERLLTHNPCCSSGVRWGVAGGRGLGGTGRGSSGPRAPFAGVGAPWHGGGWRRHTGGEGKALRGEIPMADPPGATRVEDMVFVDGGRPLAVDGIDHRERKRRRRGGGERLRGRAVRADDLRDLARPVEQVRDGRVAV